MDHPGDQGLAGARLPHEQDGGPARGHFFDELPGFPDRRTFPHDDQVMGFFREFHPQRLVFLAQMFFPGPDLEVEADKLDDEGGHDAEEPDILLKGDILSVEAVHAQDPDGRALKDNGHSHAGDLPLVEVPGLGFIQEQGFLAPIGHHKRLGGAENQAGDALVQGVNPRLLFFEAQAVRGADAEMAGFRIFEGDRAPLHGQGIGQYGQNGLKGLIEVQGLADNLTNLVENL